MAPAFTDVSFCQGKLEQNLDELEDSVERERKVGGKTGNIADGDGDDDNDNDNDDDDNYDGDDDDDGDDEDKYDDYDDA